MKKRSGPPCLSEAESLWNIFWKQYTPKTVAKEINIQTVLEHFSPPVALSNKVRKLVNIYSEDVLISLFSGIACGETLMDISDQQQFFARYQPFLKRNLNRLHQEYGKNLEEFKKEAKLLKKIAEQFDMLRPLILKGPPPTILVDIVKQCDMLRPLQYSYYKYVIQESHNILVDVAVIACLLINIDLWFEVLQNTNNFRELIIEPLSKGQDIRSLLPS